MSNVHLLRAVRTSLLLAAVAAPVAAQAPVGAESMSPAAVAESVAVLKTLDDAINANKNDAALWLHQGMVAWALSIRAEAKPEIKGLDANKNRKQAENSLRTAAELQPRNARYQVAVGTFLRTANDPISRLKAADFLDAALTVARAGSDTVTRAVAALEAGRVKWLRYDTDAHKRQYLGTPPLPPPEDCGVRNGSGLSPSLDSATVVGNRSPNSQQPLIILSVKDAVKRLHNELLACTMTLKDAGQADYAAAEALFREALAATPDDPRAFRQLAMLLAEKNRWREIQPVARAQVLRTPADPFAWLTLGLAMHRNGSTQAMAIFDTALTKLSPQERGRLFAFNRLLGAKDSASYARAAAEARDRSEKTFWQMADPLWSRPGDEARTEFLARVTFAELRWSVEELGVRGADSDRGSIYIRYGPPDSIAVIRGSDYSGMSDQSGTAFTPNKTTDVSGARMPQQSNVITFWDYDTGLTIVFWGQPTYGTARYPNDDAALVAELIEQRPAAFDNLAPGKIEDMALRTLRFRAAADSVDLVFITQAPMSDIQASTARNVPIKETVWLFGRDVPNAYRDSLTLEGVGLKAWSYRVPRSMFMYRAEATADGATVSARATTWIMAGPDTTTGFTSRGFGMSDLLLATQVEPLVATPVRWRDFDFAPVMNSIPRRSQLDLIWENYELGQRLGRATYLVSLTIQRQRSSAGQIVAQIVGAIGSVVGTNRPNNDRLTLQFDRSAASALTLVDHFGVNLGETPAGTYRITLEITDRATGRKTSRTTELAIRE